MNNCWVAAFEIPFTMSEAAEAKEEAALAYLFTKSSGVVAGCKAPRSKGEPANTAAATRLSGSS